MEKTINLDIDGPGIALFSPGREGMGNFHYRFSKLLTGDGPVGNMIGR